MLTKTVITALKLSCDSADAKLLTLALNVIVKK